MKKIEKLFVPIDQLKFITFFAQKSFNHQLNLILFCSLKFRDCVVTLIKLYNPHASKESWEVANFIKVKKHMFTVLKICLPECLSVTNFTRLSWVCGWVIHHVYFILKQQWVLVSKTYSEFEHPFYNIRCPCSEAEHTKLSFQFSFKQDR